MSITIETFLEALEVTDLSPQNKIVYNITDVGGLLHIGDHLAVLLKEKIWHHGIFVGRDDSTHELMVIDVNGEKKGVENEMTISKRPYIEFVQNCVGKKVVVVQYIEKKDDFRAVNIAETLSKFPLVAGNPYNILLNNCEHFAMFCKTLRCDITCNHLLSTVYFSPIVSCKTKKICF